MITLLRIRQESKYPNKTYHVYIADTGQPITAVHRTSADDLRKGFTIYGYESKDHVLAHVRRRPKEQKIIFDVFNAEDVRVAVLRKYGRPHTKKWHIYDKFEKNIQLSFCERKQVASLIRQIWQFFPLTSNLPYLFKYSFQILQPARNKPVVGKYCKVSRLNDELELHINDELEEFMPKRVLTAVAVLLDVF